MSARTISRWIVVILSALMALAATLTAVSSMVGVRAGPDVNQMQRLLPLTGYTVGGPCGATIQACINNPIVVNGDRILIPAGTYSESLTLNKAVSLIGADADTTIVHAVSGQRVMTVTGNTITATTVISDLTFTGGGEGASGGGILLTGGAQPLIQDMIIANNLAYAGGGVYADAGSQLRVVDTRFLNNTATYGGGADFSDAATLIDCRFENNQADHGGGVLASESPLTLTNVVFVGNISAFGSGGGVLAWTVNVIGGRFENNAAKTYGSGGGVYAHTLSVVGTSFIGNTAYGQVGGGAFVLEKAIVLDGYFENNRAVEGSGGGLYANNLTLVNTTFVSNTALPSLGGGGYGGGASAGVATLVGNYFEHNEAQVGGGLFAGGAEDLVATQFISNIAHSAGGGLFSIDDLTVTNSVFMENTAADGGGLFQTVWYGYGTNPSAHLVNSVLVRNVASGNGAGVYLSSPGQATILYTTIADVGINPRQAIAVFSGTVGITNTIITSHTMGISQTAGTVYEDYNLFYGNTTNKSGTISGGANDVIGDPRFADPIGGDYHINAGSAAIGAGVNVGVFVDIDNEPRPANRIDIGADEYWAPGALKYIYLPLIRKN